MATFANASSPRYWMGNQLGDGSDLIFRMSISLCNHNCNKCCKKPCKNWLISPKAVCNLKADVQDGDCIIASNVQTVELVVSC